ncbi:MAG TPA: Error-prone repair protein ImuA [Chitinophagaceae bacterium]|nr:Error-prone repair protein ImuA [Chitinophagaceae bacterium]
MRKEILLPRLRNTGNETITTVNLGPINHSFPDHTFPTAAVHEFCCTVTEDTAATSGFISGILSALMSKGGASLWISSSRTLFPPALSLYGIEPDKIIFIDLQKERDVLWAIEEALKCEGLAAVVGEIPDISFTASRRLQLAVEQSRVTGFIIRRTSRKLNITASTTCWKITSLPSALPGGMPGVGFPRWNVELLKVRNGIPASWQIEWNAGRFHTISKLTAIPLRQRRKTG